MTLTLARGLSLPTASRRALEAIQNVGEGEFVRSVVDTARAYVRAGLALRADIKVAGFIAHKPELEEE